MANDQFVLDIRKFVEKTKIKPDLVLRKVALDLFSAVVLRTPVDTGLLRGNWQVGIGEMPKGKVSTKSTGPVDSTSMFGSLSGAKFGTSIYLVNNLPYAAVVEYGAYPDPVKRGTYVPAGRSRYGITGPGWVKRSVRGFSRQAPSGMVRVSLANVKATMDRAIEGMT